MYPHERSLVKRLKNKPFALLGINSDGDVSNSDSDREKLKEILVKKLQITWRFWCDGNGYDGPIARKWNIDGWPTVFVLDAKGVIRYRLGVNLGGRTYRQIGENLDKAVDKLLQEMEDAGS
jgi:hypothetical protein